ncbi:hypothetical protein P4O66_018814, partial [Electrophorus voltai]
CPFLVQHLTSCIPVIGGVLFVFVVISLLQTSFTDPGILPRATPEEAADIEKQIDNPINSSSSYRPPPRTKEVVINEQVVKLKYCFTCKIFRPPRTSHCSLCDNCVERFDHHCPWVGNCVGKRNYRFFYMFIVSLSFHTAFIFGCVTTHLALRSQGGNGLVFALQQSPARYPFAHNSFYPLLFFTALELVVCFFSVWSILGLSGFHTYLVAANLTTNEDIKGSWSGKSGNEESGNPFSYNNIFKNCCSVLCGPMPPSLIDRRGFVPTEDEVRAVPAEMELPTIKTDINMRTQGTKGLSEMATHSLHPSSTSPQAIPPALDTPRTVAPSATPGRPKASRGRQLGSSSHRHHSQHKSKVKRTTPQAPHPDPTSSSPVSAAPKRGHGSRSHKDPERREPKFSPLH